MVQITEELYKELLTTLRALKNSRFKAKDAPQVAYWENEINKVKILIKKYEEQSNHHSAASDDNDDCSDCKHDSA